MLRIRKPRLTIASIFLSLTMAVFSVPSQAAPKPVSEAVKKLLQKMEQLSKQQSELQKQIEQVLEEGESSSHQPGEGGVFDQEIRPIFQNNCVQCHNASLSNGEFNLTTKASFFEGGKSGQAIVPGEPNASLLVQMIRHEQKPYMPFGGDKLPDNEIKTIEEWIRNGAQWAGDSEDSFKIHWAYEPPQEPEIPEGSNSDWVQNPIDAFVLAKLDEKGLQPNSRADKRTLIRRLYLDLTGLPPSPTEVNRFLHDDSPNAYEKVVNRLLASPHYGERWATHWLDLARYADSNGYEKDRQREMWPYRDYVIEAFNQDMPFDQFTIEQLAGDLLPGSTLKQKVATGYHRNTMINEEGGVNQEEYRVAAVIDRTNTTATVWMGTTLACAQCHDHKYDPLTQKDYYRFMAFFNNTKKEVKQYQSFSALSDGPLVEVPQGEQKQIIEDIEPKIERLQQRLDQQTPALDEAMAQWEKQVKREAIDWNILQPETYQSESGAELSIRRDSSILAGGIAPTTDTYHVEATVETLPITGIRLDILPDGSLPEGGPGREEMGRFTLSEFEVYAEPLNREGKKTKLQLLNPTADWKSGQIKDTVDGKTNTGWGNGLDNIRPFEAVYQTPNLHLVNEKVKLTFVLKSHQGDEEIPGRFRLAVTSEENPIAQEIPDDVFEIIFIPKEKRSDDQSEKLAAYFRSTSPLLDPIRDEIAKLKEKLPDDLPTVLVMRELEEPRQTHVFDGGSYLNPTEPVQPQIPAVFGNLPPQEGCYNRLDLVQWLVDEENPLTARVFVNRIWEQIFGYGIVKTVEDFGTRGELPVNQKLLDWLALHFMESNWSLKSLLYTIVTSSTYQQDSSVTEKKLEVDPENRYLSRGPRFRLRAEFIRDNALAISGLLEPDIGGPSVFPYQPDGIWQMPYSNAKWVMSDDGDQYRRGLYTHWQRTATYPMYVNFDAPSREGVCTRRIHTNTPLQALNLLNDPAYFEMAKALAKRMVEEWSGSVEERLRYGFRLCTSRSPGVEELNDLKSFYDKELSNYQENQSQAHQLLGDAKAPEGVAPAEMAAYTLTANVLLNLDETITKG